MEEIISEGAFCLYEIFMKYIICVTFGKMPHKNNKVKENMNAPSERSWTIVYKSKMFEEKLVIQIEKYTVDTKLFSYISN